jgi:hypothetical protein
VAVFDAAVKMESDLRNDLSYLQQDEQTNTALNQIRMITVIQGDSKQVYKRIPELNGLMNTVQGRSRQIVGCEAS